MQNAFEEVRQQIHEIRNILGPIDIKLDSLDHKITASRITLESKVSDLDAKNEANLLRISQQAIQISEHSDEITQQSERLKRIEQFLKIQNPEKHSAAPVHEHKANPAVIPPQSPPA